MWIASTAIAGPAFVVSPYSSNGVDDQYYTQLNMVKTIEQILGIPPMNQEDDAAEPMYDAFTAHPDFAPYNAAAESDPAEPGSARGFRDARWYRLRDLTRAERKDFRSAGPGAGRHAHRVQRLGGMEQTAGGPAPLRRSGPGEPGLLNRFDWYSAHNWTVAYPGDPEIYTPNEVPGKTAGRLPRQ